MRALNAGQDDGYDGRGGRVVQLEGAMGVDSFQGFGDGCSGRLISDTALIFLGSGRRKAFVELVTWQSIESIEAMCIINT